MFDIERTDVFDAWMKGLRDRRGAGVIASRIDRMARGNTGNIEPVGDGVHELKIDFGPGYRVYFTDRGGVIRLLLCGGDKDSQARDIKRAKQLAKEV